MSSFRSPRRVAAALAASLSLAAAAVAQGPTCWNPSLGSNLSLGDDQLAVGLTLAFPFDMPGGGTTTSIDVSSNGFVGLVSGAITDSGCCDGDVFDLLNDAQRIAAVWMDLDPSSGGGVYFDSQPTHATVTWLHVPEYFDGGDNTVQLTLFPGGAFTLSFLSLNAPGGHDLLVGCSPGGGAADPGELDYSTAPHATAGVPTVYELFDNALDVRDLAGSAFLFQPDGVGGYLVIPIGPCAQATPYGNGCPADPVFYELFDATLGAFDLSNRAMLLQRTASGYTVNLTTAAIDPSFANNLLMGDDDLSVGNPLGFTVVLPGFGAVSAVDIDSNGRVGFGLPYSDYVEDVMELMRLPVIAPLWHDLNPSAAGGVYFDALPTKAMVTWDQVPEYPSSGANTFQVQLFPNGDILIVHGACSATDALVGYSPAGTPDPGPTDISAAVPFALNAGALRHVNSGGAVPVLGTTLGLELQNLPGNTAVAVANIGFTPLGLDLTRIGMRGCSLLTSVEIAIPVALTGAIGTAALPIPANPAFAGITLNTQGFALVPGINTLGAISSNAIAQRLGN